MPKKNSEPKSIITKEKKTSVKSAVNFRDFSDKIKDIIENQENEKKDDLKIRITEINNAEVCIEIYGDVKKTEVFFADLKIKLENILGEVLRIEYVSDIFNTTHKINFKGKREINDADEILSVLSKYDEGAPSRGNEYED